MWDVEMLSKYCLFIMGCRPGDFGFAEDNWAMYVEQY